MITVLIVLTVFYCILMCLFFFGAVRINEFKGYRTKRFESFSILIAFRNEEDHLDNILQKLYKLEYPKDKFEVVFVNDHSSDSSVSKIEKFISSNQASNMHLFHLPENQKGKKMALNYGIQQARYEWILCTDADCLMNENWIVLFNQFILKYNPDMVVAPVGYKEPKNALEIFQVLDLASLQLATVGGFGLGIPFLSNGANLAFRKSAFEELEGYSSHSEMASGDDIFLLHSFLSHNKLVRYLKSPNVTVRTYPEQTLDKLVQQRRRWAAKARSYKNPFALISAVIVFMMNLSLIIGLIFCLINGLSWKLLGIIFFWKFVMDGLGIGAGLYLINRIETFFHYYWAAFVYPFFSVFIAVSSLFRSYKWKDRYFRQ